MLVLTRKRGQRIKIGDDIYVTILTTRQGSVSLGLDAPRATRIMRDELLPHADEIIPLTPEAGTA